MMIANIRELLTARDLLYMWSWREIRTRYKQSMLGMGWAIVQPLAMTIVYVVVFTAIVRVPSDGIPYPLFAYTALLPWTFLASSISTGVPSLVANMGLVTKIYFPREVLPLAAVIGRLFDFMWASVVLLGMLLIYQVTLTPAILWLPLLLALQVVLTIGVVLLGAALNVAYRDVGQLIPLVTQIWMYASPVIYPVSLVPDRFRVLYYLNPMAGLIDGYRNALLLGKAPDGLGLLLSAAMSLVVMLAGYAYFKKVEVTFADII
jgi:lipopolysaccharide transport system permease protein